MSDWGKIYTDKVRRAAIDFADEQLFELRDEMGNDEYNEIRTGIINTFLRGANCARQAIVDIVEERRKEKEGGNDEMV